jgi:hypothetical protein
MASDILIPARNQNPAGQVGRRQWLILGVVVISLIAIGIISLLTMHSHSPAQLIGAPAEMGWYP